MTAQFMAMAPTDTRLQSYPNPDFAFGTGDFTIVLMPRPLTAGTVVNCQSQAANDGYRAVIEANGAISFTAWFSGTPTTVSTVANAVQISGSCHCVAIRRVSGQLSILIDFVAAPLASGGTSASMPGSIATASPPPFTLGGDRSSSGTFSGGLMNAGVWSRGLSDVELEQAGFAVLSPLQAGLVAYWTLNQTTADSSPNQNALQIYGSITYRQCMDCVWLHGENDYRFLQMQTSPYVPGSMALAEGAAPVAGNMIVETRPIHVPAGAPAMALALMKNEVLGPAGGVTGASLTLTDPDGVVYDTTQNTDTLFVHVVNSVPTAMMIISPKPGVWQVNVTCDVSQPLYLQVQVLPSQDVVATATTTLTPIFDPQDGRTMMLAAMGFWSFVGMVAVAAVAGAVAAAVVVASGGTALPAVVAGLVAFSAVGTAELMATVPTMSPDFNDASIQTGGLAGFIVANSKLQTIDANCDGDRATVLIYKQRLKKFFPAIPASGFKTKTSQLIGDQDTKTNVSNALTALGPGYVSASGHGLETYLMGWYVSGNSGPLQQVITKGQFTAAQAQNKIFHLFACRTGAANGLGQALVSAGAVAFFGYNIPVIISVSETPAFCIPDIEIDKQLIIGKTCAEAYNASMALYRTNIARLRADGNMSAASNLERNMNALVSPSTSAVYGNKDARLQAGV